jgi:hypothetical protein
MQSVAARVGNAARGAAIDLAAASPVARDSGPGAVHSPAPEDGRFSREGDYWTMGVGETTVRLKHLRGFTYIGHLLRRPGVDVHVFDLVDLADGVTLERGQVVHRDAGDGGPVLDDTARAEVKARLRELDEELAEAEEANDLGRIERYRAEIERLADYLTAASGLGGRDRGAATQANRARIAVAKAIRIALARIAAQSPDLARHLERTIDTGTFCSYVPDPRQPIDWMVG